jgi:hypothetical protein
MESDDWPAWLNAILGEFIERHPNYRSVGLTKLAFEKTVVRAFGKTLTNKLRYSSLEQRNRLFRPSRKADQTRMAKIFQDLREELTLYEVRESVYFPPGTEVKRYGSHGSQGHRR